MSKERLGTIAFNIMTCVISKTNPLLKEKLYGSARKLAATTKTPVFKNWKKLILTINTVLNYVKVSFLYFSEVYTKNIWMTAFIIEIDKDEAVLINSCVLLS